MQWTNDQPIYQQVRDHVVSLLIDDVLKSGDPIPSVRQMAVEGGVNPLTVSKAYQELVDLNIVEKRRGLGMFITDSAKKELVKLERNKFMEFGKNAKENSKNFYWDRIVKKYLEII